MFTRKGDKVSGYQAQITYGGQNHYLGKFQTEEEAARAYDEAARQHYGAAFSRYLLTDFDTHLSTQKLWCNLLLTKTRDWLIFPQVQLPRRFRPKQGPPGQARGRALDLPLPRRAAEPEPGAVARDDKV